MRAVQCVPAPRWQRRQRPCWLCCCLFSRLFLHVCVSKHSCGLKQTQLDLPDWEPGFVPLLTSNTYTMPRCVFVLYCICCITSYVYINIHNKIVYLCEENSIVISSSTILSLLMCLFMMCSRVAVWVNRFRGSVFTITFESLIFILKTRLCETLLFYGFLSASFLH